MNAQNYQFTLRLGFEYYRMDQHRLKPCSARTPVLHTIGTRGPWCERMTRPAPAHALCVWGTWLVQHRHQWGLGVPRCLKQSRQMLVLPGAPVSNTISTSKALLYADAWTSIDSCLLLVGAPGWHNISTGGTLVLVLLGAPVWHTIGTRGPWC